MSDDPQFMDVEQYHALLGNSAKRSKYGNKRVKADGYTFDSQAEYTRYCELKLLVEHGVISRLEVHPTFKVSCGYMEPHTGEKIKARHYEADFRYWHIDDMIECVEDVKGVQTAVFKLKWDLVRYRYPDLRFELVNV